MGSFAPNKQRWALQPPEQLTPEPHAHCSSRKKMSLLTNKLIPKQLTTVRLCISKSVAFFAESKAALPSEAGSN